MGNWLDALGSVWFSVEMGQVDLREQAKSLGWAFDYGPYQGYRFRTVPVGMAEYTVPASNSIRLTPLFRTGKNTGRTGLVLANFGQKKVFF